jgi:hypothetical protein
MKATLLVLCAMVAAGCSNPTAPKTEKPAPCLAPYILDGYIHWCPKGSPQPRQQPADDSSHQPVPNKPAVDVCDSACEANIGKGWKP